MKIDIVIPWVDGSDPVLREKKALYGDAKSLSRPDVGGETRYSDLGEIHWCVASINRYAPYINKIYIVTDGQDPHVESRIPVEIVDHRAIFKDYQEYLPVFNSSTIETMIWNIPGLSEHFLLMNDDFLFAAPSHEEDFFLPDGRVVCYGCRKSSLWAEFVYLLSIVKYGYGRATYKKVLMNGSRMAGDRWAFFYLYHTPRPFLKSVFEDYFKTHPESVIVNMKHRFRHPAQFQSQSLQYSYLFNMGRLEVADDPDCMLFVRHWKGREKLMRKISKAAAKPSFRFACFNSLDEASAEERTVVEDWINNIV